MGEYPEVNDSWMDIISSQGLSLLSVDLSGSSVTDDGLSLLKDCSNIQVLSFNYCDQISEPGLKNISGNTLCVCVYIGYISRKKLCCFLIFVDAHLYIPNLCPGANFFFFLGCYKCIYPLTCFHVLIINFPMQN